MHKTHRLVSAQCVGVHAGVASRYLLSPSKLRLHVVNPSERFDATACTKVVRTAGAI
jgi:hypothetical protein